MRPFDDSDHSHPSVDPAAIDLGETLSISIDIGALLRAHAAVPAKRGNGSPATADANIAPLIGMVSRSVDFALGFLELPHFRILILLSERDSMPMSEIAAAMAMRSRTLSTLLHSMEATGWLTISGPDRGISDSATITEQGRAVVDDVTSKRQREIDEILQRLSDTDRAMIDTAFSSFAVAANEPAIRKRDKGSPQ
ncbi:MAG TPA: MarR family transcriptional regulator [Galbitalea sp.]